MILLHNRKDAEILFCLSLSHGINKFDEIREFIAKRKNIFKGRVSISILGEGIKKKISKYNMDNIIPFHYKKHKIIIEIQPSIIEMEIVNLLNRLEIN